MLPRQHPLFTLPYHHPVLLAKRLATIDVLSKGRMRLLTVGPGSLPGDGYFPGGALDPGERAAQLDLARSAAVGAGRPPEALQYTRWGSIDMTHEQVAARTTIGELAA